MRDARYAGIVKTLVVCFDAAMSQPSTCSPLYRGYRFPPEVITWCVWLYYRFSLSLRDVSDVMLARGIEVSHEAIRLWTLRFGTEYARRLLKVAPDTVMRDWRLAQGDAGTAFALRSDAGVIGGTRRAADLRRGHCQDVGGLV
jgi:hypothetical protein